MSQPPSQPNSTGSPLIVLVGPTAVGKTEVAIELCEALNGEIVSADSRLFYRGMDIGTAKPSLEERQRIVHYLVDVADPDETWSLAIFQEEARKAIETIYSRGKLPFLVGGTGQYIRAVTQGWETPRVEPDPRLRLVLENWAKEIGGQGLYDRLKVLDPAAALTIDPRNLRRTVRGLEVILTTGRLFSDQRLKGSSIYNQVTLGLSRPRTELYARIDTRIERMLQDGWVDEVRGFLEKGYSADLPSLSAIGYKEIVAHLQGHLSLEEAVVEIKRATRVYVRRQANWFKPTDPGIYWFEAGEGTVEQMVSFIKNWLEADQER